MCDAIMYVKGHELIRSYYVNPKACLPVRQRSGDIIEMAWGRRPEQSGSAPFGGQVTIEILKSGAWDQFFPRAIKLPVAAYLVRRKQRRQQETWIDLLRPQWLQGVVIKDGDLQRAYIITIPVDGWSRKPRLEWG